MQLDAGDGDEPDARPPQRGLPGGPLAEGALLDVRRRADGAARPRARGPARRRPHGAAARSTAGRIDLLLEAPELFSRIIAEEAAGEPPRTTDAAATAGRPAARRPTRRAAPAATIRSTRSRSVPRCARSSPSTRSTGCAPTCRRGSALYRVRVTFELATFDQELSALSGRLKRSWARWSRRCRPPTSAIRRPSPSSCSSPRARDARWSCARPGPARGRRAGAGPAPAGRPRPAGAPARGSGAPADGERRSGGDPLARARARTRIEAIAPLRLADGPRRHPQARPAHERRRRAGAREVARSSASPSGSRAQSGDAVLAVELHRRQPQPRAAPRRAAGGHPRGADGPARAGLRQARPHGPQDRAARSGRRSSSRSPAATSSSTSSSSRTSSDPLMHLIRNAIDHAIEPPEVRARAREAARRAASRLAASQKGNHVQIVVEDDGGGHRRGPGPRGGGRSAGSPPPRRCASSSRREVMNLIFVPGFSTARQVTALSGRGVGMDVVKNNIASALRHHRPAHRARPRHPLRDHAAGHPRHHPGAGGRGRRAGPTRSRSTACSRSWRCAAADVRTLSTREVITLRGATLPLVRLAPLLRVRGRAPPDPFFVVVVGLAQERLGIAVDELLGQQDIVVKPLGAQLQGVRGIAGATDLGTAAHRPRARRRRHHRGRGLRRRAPRRGRCGVRAALGLRDLL